jgi:tetratricopeptide (TPR) repeat protein
VAEVERGQPPGVRRLRDFVTLTPRVFSDPNPLAPHMYRSVWGSVYVNVWADLYRESDVARALEAEREERRSTTALALLGLLPSGLALAGAGLALRDLMRGRRRALWTAPLLLSAATLVSFGLFAWRVPIWSALKASYLLGLSLPFALFLCRAVEELMERGRRRTCAALAAGLATVAVAASLVAIDGFVLPRRADAPATGAVRFYFGEYEAARQVYQRLIAGAGYPVPWLDNLAAVELADGNPNRASLLYARAVKLESERGHPNAYRQGQQAAATALDGDLESAHALLDEILGRTRLPELLANRAVLRAAQGDPVRASIDFVDALAQAPELVVARLNLAGLLEHEGRTREAQEARAAAAQAACRAPRGFPYGVGTGEVLEWGVGRRWLLLLEDGELAPALPSFFREACARLSGAANAPAPASPR